MMRRAALLGGNWNDGDWSGSRNARVTNWPDNSNEWIGARGRSDDRDLCFSSRGSAWLGHASHAESGNLLRALGVDGGLP